MEYLNWQEHQVTYLLGVLPERDESGDPYFAYEWAQDGLEVLLTIFDASGAVGLSLTKAGATLPLFDVNIENCPHIDCRRDDGREWLEFSPPASKERMLRDAIQMGLRLFVKPNLAVQFFSRH